MKYRTDVWLKDYTTLKIGGPAARFYEPESIEEIRLILLENQKENRPLVLLGNGSNMLFEDEGYDGSVLHIGANLAGIEDLGQGRVRVYAGEENGSLAGYLADHGLSGYEFASGIPGTLGGAVIMNAGAYDGELCDVLRLVGWMDEQGILHESAAEELEFGYRHSWFSDHFGVVLYADLQLEREDPKIIHEKIQTLHERRHSKQPMDKASAGSTFKRPSKGYASALIQQCGLQGRSVGDAMVSTKHAGFLINNGSATCKEFLELVRQVQEEVRSRTGVELEMEVRFVPRSA